MAQPVIGKLMSIVVLWPTSSTARLGLSVGQGFISGTLEVCFVICRSSEIGTEDGNSFKELTLELEVTWYVLTRRADQPYPGH